MYLPSESATQKSSYLGKRGFCLIPTVETWCQSVKGCLVLSSGSEFASCSYLGLARGPGATLVES